MGKKWICIAEFKIWSTEQLKAKSANIQIKRRLITFVDMDQKCIVFTLILRHYSNSGIQAAAYSGLLYSDCNSSINCRGTNLVLLLTHTSTEPCPQLWQEEGETGTQCSLYQVKSVLPPKEARLPSPRICIPVSPPSLESAYNFCKGAKTLGNKQRHNSNSDPTWKTRKTGGRASIKVSIFAGWFL